MDRFYSYRRDKDEEALLESFRNYLKCCSNYGSDIKLSWQTRSASSYALVPIIPESDIPNLIRFFKEYAATESAKELIKEKNQFYSMKVKYLFMIWHHIFIHYH